MDGEVVEALLPAAGRAGLVFLQGWGEPLCHPDLPGLVRRFKERECLVGTTTNAVLLDEYAVAALVEAGLDVLAVSLAGASPQTNDVLRRGTRLEQVREAVERVRRARARRGSDRPRIHVAYLLLRSGLGEIDDLPDLLGALGAEEAVVSSLTLPRRAELAQEAVLADGPEQFEQLRRRLLAVRDRAAERGVRLSFQVADPAAHPGGCTERPGRAVFVDVTGGVHPCVFCGLPQGAPLVQHHPRAGEVAVPQRTFGNVRGQPLGAVWRGKAYRAFRKHHARRHAPADSPCALCLKRTIVDLEPTPELVPLP